MYPPKPAVRHDEHVIAGAALAEQLLYERIDAVGDRYALAETRHGARDIPFDIRSLIHPNSICKLQRLRKRGAVRAELHCVRSGLEHGDYARGTDFAPETFDGRGHGGRMMREVVVDRNALDRAAD